MQNQHCVKSMLKTVFFRKIVLNSCKISENIPFTMPGYSGYTLLVSQVPTDRMKT